MWTDPQTGMKFVVDSRTGNSRPLNTGSGHSETTSEDKEFVDNPRRTLNTLLSSKKGSAQEDAPQWIRNALEVCVHLIIYHRGILMVIIQSAE